MMSRVRVTPIRAPVDPVELDSVVPILDEYRQHYGQQSAPARTRDWLVTQLERRVLSVFVARLDGATVGLATTFVAPATHVLGHVWQLRDLYVVPVARRHRVGTALVAGVRDAATAEGAIRLSLQTEPGNEAALRLYRGLGFGPVDGVVALTLSLGR
jgi:GNAT superfamily N-acetyltransferase